MATVDELQKDHETRVSALVNQLAGRGQESDWALARALVHRAIHLVSERRAAEYCAVATLLGEMIGHAHQLLHGGDKPSAAHGDVVH